MAESEISTDCEISAVKEIYEELEVENDDTMWKLKILLEPRVKHGEQKNVSAQVIINLSAKYPNEKPRVSFETCRGLSDEKLSYILENLQSFLELRIGHPVIFDLLQHLLDYLDSNLPCTPCILCLDHFDESNRVFKTECFHFFHASCFIRYVKHEEREKQNRNGNQSRKEKPELSCPICRLKISYNEEVADLMQLDTMISEETLKYKPTEGFINWKKKQEKLWPIYLKQKGKGGIINIEENKTKFLVKADTTISKKHCEHDNSTKKNTRNYWTRQRRKSNSTNLKVNNDCNVTNCIQRRKSFPFILSTNLLESKFIENFSSECGEYEQSWIFSETEMYKLKHSTFIDKEKNSLFDTLNEKLKNTAADNRKTSKETTINKKLNGEKNLDSCKQFSNFRGTRRNFGSRRQNYPRSHKPHYKRHDSRSDITATEESKGKQYESNSVTGREKRHFFKRHNHHSGQGHAKNSQAYYPTTYGRNREYNHYEEYRGGQRGPRPAYRGRGRARNGRKFNKDVKDEVKN